MPEYTIDEVEKQAVGRLARGGVLGRLMIAHFSATDPVDGKSTVTLVFKDQELDESVDTPEIGKIIVASDPGLSTPSTVARFQDASKGEILNGETYAVADVESDAAGDQSEFVCEVENLAGGLVYVGMLPTTGVVDQMSVSIDFG